MTSPTLVKNIFHLTILYYFILLFRLSLFICLIGLGSMSCSQYSTTAPLEAPNRAFSYVSQRGISHKACGPTSIINAFGAGSQKWQAIIKSQGSPKGAVRNIISYYGAKPSTVFRNKKRWNHRHGMNIEDLTYTANELRAQSSPMLPQIRSRVMVSNAAEGATRKHLQYIERTFAQSLRQGLPPIANVSRNVLRRTPASRRKIWDVIGSHSVVITSLGQIQANSTGQYSLPIMYVDPVLGKEQQGFITLASTTKDYPNHSVIFQAGKLSQIFRSPEKNFLSLSSVIGAF